MSFKTTYVTAAVLSILITILALLFILAGPAPLAQAGSGKDSCANNSRLCNTETVFTDRLNLYTPANKPPAFAPGELIVKFSSALDPDTLSPYGRTGTTVHPELAKLLTRTRAEIDGPVFPGVKPQAVPATAYRSRNDRHRPVQGCGQADCYDDRHC